MLRKAAMLVMIFSYSLFFVSLAYALSWDEDNPDELNPGETVTISINGNCPPYTWEVEGKGFSIGAAITQEKSNTLNSDADACGSAVIAVKDSCGGGVSGYARGGVGYWNSIVDEMCGRLVRPDPEPIGCCGGCKRCSVVVQGEYKFEDCWFGGNLFDQRYEGPFCSKWAATEDLTGQHCNDPGYYFPMTMLGFMDHKMWRWECPGVKLELPSGTENNDCKDKISE